MRQIAWWLGIGVGLLAVGSGLLRTPGHVQHAICTFACGGLEHATPEMPAVDRPAQEGPKRVQALVRFAKVM